jgi:RimJ/RimL family protein N-acetyltransferase
MALSPPRRIELPGFMMRAWSPGDAPLLQAALTASDAHLRAWTPWVVDGRVPGLSLEERLQRHAAQFAAGQEWVYGLFTTDESQVLGGCGLYPRIGPRAIEIGYWLAVGQTGRGLATRAAEALTRVAFTDADIAHVEIRCDRRNVASMRVPERLGYHAADIDTGEGDEIVAWQLTRAAHRRAEDAQPRR